MPPPYVRHHHKVHTVDIVTNTINVVNPAPVQPVVVQQPVSQTVVQPVVVTVPAQPVKQQPVSVTILPDGTKIEKY
ncbi:MAG: hypothetical protein IKD29_01225 [Lentisphaeria bacterium]|nr:hypothetical protein [Lentisphaeria bacterium]